MVVVIILTPTSLNTRKPNVWFGSMCISRTACWPKSASTCVQNGSCVLRRRLVTKTAVLSDFSISYHIIKKREEECSRSILHMKRFFTNPNHISQRLIFKTCWSWRCRRKLLSVRERARGSCCVIHSQSSSSSAMSLSSFVAEQSSCWV